MSALQNVHHDLSPLIVEGGEVSAKPVTACYSNRVTRKAHKPNSSGPRKGPRLSEDSRVREGKPLQTPVDLAQSTNVVKPPGSTGRKPSIKKRGSGASVGGVNPTSTGDVLSDIPRAEGPQANTAIVTAGLITGSASKLLETTSPSTSDVNVKDAITRVVTALSRNSENARRRLLEREEKDRKESNKKFTIEVIPSNPSSNTSPPPRPPGIDDVPTVEPSPIRAPVVIFYNVPSSYMDVIFDFCKYKLPYIIALMIFFHRIVQLGLDITDDIYQHLPKLLQSFFIASSISFSVYLYAKWCESTAFTTFDTLERDLITPEGFTALSVNPMMKCRKFSTYSWWTSRYISGIEIAWFSCLNSMMNLPLVRDVASGYRFTLPSDFSESILLQQEYTMNLAVAVGYNAFEVVDYYEDFAKELFIKYCSPQHHEYSINSIEHDVFELATASKQVDMKSALCINVLINTSRVISNRIQIKQYKDSLVKSNVLRRVVQLK